MKTAMMAAISGGRRRGIAWSANFTGFAPGPLVTLPSGLILTRASAATVQTGTSSVVTAGIGTDVARIGRASDSDPFGLVIEPTRTNLFPYARQPNNAGLTAGAGDTYPTTNNVQPDGTAAGIEVVTVAGNASKYYTAGALSGQTLVMSEWVAKGPGSGAYQMWFETSGGITGSPVFGTASAAWGRIATPPTAGGASLNYAIPQYGPDLTSIGGTTALVRDAVTDLIQFESGKWASEAIITSGASATRANERLYHPTPSQIIQSSRINLALRFQAKHSPANADADFYLYANSTGSDYAYIGANGSFAAVSGTTSSTSPGTVVWSAGDIVDIFFSAGASATTVFAYRVNGGATVHPTVTGVAGNYGTAGLSEFGQHGGVNSIGARIYEIDAYRNGYQPYWVAL